MFMERPRSATRGHRGAERVEGARFAILDQLEPDQEPAAADVANRIVLRLTLPQAGHCNRQAQSARPGSLAIT